MNYRIRYRQAGDQRDAETLVEANSPTEALVKFRCTRRFAPDAAAGQEQVTSVSSDDHSPPAPR